MKKYFLICLFAISNFGFAAVEKFKTIDQGGSGPYKSIAATETLLSNYVVYRPKHIQKTVKKEGPLPVVVFANGGCMDTSIPFERLLSEVASHGYIVIALGALQKTLDDRELSKAGNSMMTHAIDWLTTQAGNKQTDYYNSVDLKRIASAGQSCGGAQVLAVASDPRFKTFMMFNSGIGDMDMAGATRKSLKNVHGPIVYIVGGETDVATENAKLDYKRIEHVPVAFANHLTAGHSGTFEEQYGGSFSKIALIWLQWQLKGSNEDAHVFLKPELRDFSGWAVESKQFDHSYKVKASSSENSDVFVAEPI